MPYLRIIKTSKKVNNSKFVEELFSIDPDPRTRGNIVPENWAEGLPVDASPELIEQRQHPLSWLPGGVGPKKSSEFLPREYSNPDEAAGLFFIYGKTFRNLADDGAILLRYGKLNSDGRSVSTYIVFLKETHWTDILKPAFDDIHTHLTEVFDVTESGRAITDLEYNRLVTSFNSDIANMKVRDIGKCRLDFINKERL